MTTSNEHNNAPAVPQGEAWGYVDHRGCAIKFKNDRHRSELANAIECGGLEYLHTSPAAKLGNDIESALESLVERCNNDAGMSNEDAVIHAEAVLERVYNSRSATPASAPAQYKDSTPQLSVGVLSFESWFESYNPANKGDKQRSRDAYAAGMGDPLVAAAPAVPQTVYLVENRTCLLAYASREDADKAVASMPASVGGGFLVSPVQVFGAPSPAPAPAQGEPFGHFRAEPFGWTDCAKDDEGAIALYERPQEWELRKELDSANDFIKSLADLIQKYETMLGYRTTNAPEGAYALAEAKGESSVNTELDLACADSTCQHDFALDPKSSIRICLKCGTPERLAKKTAAPAQELGLTDEEIEAIAKKHMSTVGDHWCNEDAIRERHAEDFARAIIAALRAKGGK